MKKYKWIIILINLIILLTLFNNDILQKEALLSDGQLILLELAPVDPRSLMQGDYMRLRYAIAENVDVENVDKRGYCVVKLNPNGVAQRVRIQKDKTPINENEFVLEYTSKRKWSINIGAESYFFQEGQAEKYENAKYGGIRVDKDGNSLLSGLYDENRQKIE